MTTNKPNVKRFNILTYQGAIQSKGAMCVMASDYDALQAECEKLRQEVEALQGIQPEMPPMPPNGKGLPRYGVRWNGPTQPLSVPKDDGFWTPWHLAQAECEKLRKDAEKRRRPNGSSD